MGERRDFLKDAGFLALGASLFGIVGCETYGGDTIIDPNSTRSFDDYLPQINNPPYFKMNFGSRKSVSNSRGEIVFENYNGRGVFPHHFVDKSGRGVEGLEGYLFSEGVENTNLAVIVDPQKRYMPYSFSPGLKGGQGSFITMSGFEDSYGDSTNNYFVKKMDAALPSWDWERFNEHPGSLYLGDWSFNELKNFNTLLKNSSMVITMAAPNPVTAASYCIFSASGSVLKGMDFFVETYNKIFSDNKIDKNEEYSIFLLGDSFVPQITVVPKLRNISDKTPREFKDYFPSEPGSFWNYNLGQRMILHGTMPINGQALLKASQGSVDYYFGFNGEKLGIYGFNIGGDIGEVFLDPPQIIGDGSVYVGKKIETNSKIFCEKYPEISGTYKSTMNYQTSEIVEAVGGIPFFGCLKVREDAIIEMKNNNTGNDYSNNVGATHWFARNIGKIKYDFGGSILRLEEYGLGKSSSEMKIGEDKMIDFGESLKEGFNNLI